MRSRPVALKASRLGGRMPLTREHLVRRLTAIFAADVAGYSRLTGVDEEGTHVRLREHLRALINPTIATYRGHIVKNTGDGFLGEFNSVVDAMRCAVDIQRGMAERNSDVPPNDRIQFRIGINVGDIIEDNGDIFGDGVNVAARLEAIAEPGGICVSDDAHRQLRDKLDIVFDDAGEQNLKNIGRPVRVFRIRDAAAATQRPTPALPSVAVLPFQNLSPDPGKREKLPTRQAAKASQWIDDGLEAAENKVDRPERRQLSVMICNVVGVGAQSLRQDPEDLLDVICAYQDRIKAVIAEYDGFIAKSMGDEVLVYFGYPRAREDDAERAVQAGLAVIDAVAALRPRSQKPLQARVAIATGLVVVGDLKELGISSEHTAIGDALPLVAGLAALAEPSSLVISAPTRRLVGALFKYNNLGVLNLATGTHPVEVWKVWGENAAASRFEALRSEPTKLIGREEELGLLQRRWSQIKTGEGRMALIYGEPGIGKSSLVFALQETLKEDPHHCLRFQCSPHRVQTPLYPLINQIDHAAGFSAGDSDTTKLDKLEALLALSSHDLSGDVALF